MNATPQLCLPTHYCGHPFVRARSHPRPGNQERVEELEGELEELHQVRGETRETTRPSDIH